MKNAEFILKSGKVSAKMLDNTITLEVNLTAINETSILDAGAFSDVTKGKRMEKLNINLKDITYYLIQLFYRTNKTYSCTQTKIGKLLSILAFKYARNGKILFNEPIYKYQPDCGTLIKDLVFINKDIYTRNFDIDDDMDSEEPIYFNFNTNNDIPNTYTEIGTISCELKADIEDIFIQFGAYPASVLGKYLNPIADKLVDMEDNELDLKKIQTISINDFENSQINQIIKYIYLR